MKRCRPWGHRRKTLARLVRLFVDHLEGELVHVNLRPIHRVILFKDNYLANMWCGPEKGSYLRLIDFCITQLYARES